MRTGTVTTPDDACAPLAAGSPDGKVALVRRGGCTGIAKGINVAAAGAVVYNNVGPAEGPPTVAGVPIPLAYIDQQDGELINARLDEGPVTLTWGVTPVPNATAGQLSGARVASHPPLASPRVSAAASAPPRG